MSVTTLPASTDPRFVSEHNNTAVVDLITDDMRDAREMLLSALRNGDIGRIKLEAQRLCEAMLLPPRAEIADCPGHLLEIERSVWHGHVVTTTRCNVCGSQESS